MPLTLAAAPHGHRGHHTSRQQCQHSHIYHATLFRAGSSRCSNLISVAKSSVGRRLRVALPSGRPPPHPREFPSENTDPCSAMPPCFERPNARQHHPLYCVPSARILLTPVPAAPVQGACAMRQNPVCLCLNALLFVFFVNLF